MSRSIVVNPQLETDERSSRNEESTWTRCSRAESVIKHHIVNNAQEIRCYNMFSVLPKFITNKGQTQLCYLWETHTNVQVEYYTYVDISYSPYAHPIPAPHAVPLMLCPCWGIAMLLVYTSGIFTALRRKRLPRSCHAIVPLTISQPCYMQDTGSLRYVLWSLQIFIT